MIEETAANSPLDAAIRRLDRAVARLEAHLDTMLADSKASSGDLFDDDRARLAADLDAAKGRERQLEAAGLQASAALGRAIADIRAALGEDIDEDEPDSPQPDSPQSDPADPDHAEMEA